MKSCLLQPAKRTVLMGSLVFFRVLLFAQPVSVKGIIKTSSGESFFNVSVRAQAEKREIFTGPDGLFSIEVSPLSSVRVSFPGYIPIIVKVKYAPIDTVLVLTQDKSTSGNAEHVRDEQQSQDVQSGFGGGGNLNIYGAGFNSSSAMLPVFSQKENTVGSRYLYDHWVKGYVVNSRNGMIANPSFSYNYDKISGELLLSQDKRTAIEIGKEQITRFCFISSTGDSMVFKVIPEINARLYSAQLVTGASYSLYALTETKLEKANYHTDGMTESGNKFDEFTDIKTYYLQEAGKDVFVKLKLTRKALQAAVPKSAPVTAYFSDHNMEPVDETFVKGLINAANIP